MYFPFKFQHFPEQNLARAPYDQAQSQLMASMEGATGSLCQIEPTNKYVAKRKAWKISQETHLILKAHETWHFKLWLKVWTGIWCNAELYSYIFLLVLTSSEDTLDKLLQHLQLQGDDSSCGSSFTQWHAERLPQSPFTQRQQPFHLSGDETVA